MKKILAGFLLLIIGVSLVGCGGDANGSKKVDSVILSKNTCEIVAGKEYELSYHVVPEDADTSNMVWKSADEEIVTVKDKNTLVAHIVGETSVYLTDGKKTFATCSVTVLPIPAYDLLSEKEKSFVDLVLRNINDFKTPDSIKFLDIAYIDGNGAATSHWVVEVSAQNGFGGSSTEIYELYSYGFQKNEYLFVMPDDGEYYRIDMINKAINDK